MRVVARVMHDPRWNNRKVSAHPRDRYVRAPSDSQLPDEHPPPHPERPQHGAPAPRNSSMPCLDEHTPDGPHNRLPFRRIGRCTPL